ncbi:acetyl-CoA carboxylase biotin carboxyl carrier protein [Christensenellaceae bacterium NSJ-44]|uniref:Biotin carboxyl carrier protein of acetyl-CoA carboxylase n=1 Tax=Luoshenia tenuis TaxID=2763654 RepID=A0A926HMD8_9FIRM|nr:acetyl-CoA carboxylase biotin carboxyl carrier protein [Luoshenia tenuis]MBC8528006.1 acetyl-CoA carboxylase biotin carboxyl carrier protein [Luoshenia tenuis]
MDIAKIKELAQLLNDAGLSALELKEGDATLRLESAKFTPAQPAPAPVMQAVPAAEPQPAASAPAAPVPDGGVDFNALSEFKSPMVGVFYAAPGPDQAPFVEVGKRVKKGDVLCIIEAMKLMNEITAEQDGEIVDICVSDGDVVEYGQTLFKIF